MDEATALCPDCGQETVHGILKVSDANITARCADCGCTHTFSPPRAKPLTLRLIISAGDQSTTDEIDTLDMEEVAVGDEFDHNGHRMLVTTMEGEDGRYHDKLLARQIKVLHAKLFDTVPLKMSVNEREVTRSHQLEVEPEREVHIGEIIAVDGRKLKVKTLKSDQNRTLHRGFLLARNVRRAFCDEVPHWVKEGKILPARRRGKPPGGTSVPRHGRKR